VTTTTGGEVFDLGYRHYDGPREGRAAARKAVWKNGMRTALGLGRGTRAKILPGLFAFALLITALVLAIMAATIDRVAPGLGEAVNIPSHSDYYGFVSLMLVIFSAIIAPELLCSDRRDGTISLYMVRPLSATDYILGRWFAFFTITLSLLYLGQIFMLVGLTLGADEPLTYLRDNWMDIPRFIGAGFAVALFATTIPMAVAAFTTRRAYAAAFVIGLFIISSAVAGSVSYGLEEEGFAAARWVALLNLQNVPIHVNDIIFDNISAATESDAGRQVHAAVKVLWYSVLVFGPALILWQRYRKLGL